MSDDRYLDGDPRADDDRVFFTDLTPFVQQTQQDMALIRDLLQAGRVEDAEQVAVGRMLRAQSVMQHLEAPTLPEVDIARSGDIMKLGERVYKERI